MISIQGKKFLVDTGAEISVVPPTIYEKSKRHEVHHLTAANGTKISTFGRRTIMLQLGKKKI